MQKEINGEKILDLTLTKASKAEKVAEATATGVLVTALKAENIEITKEEAAKLKSIIATKLKEGASLKEAIATALVTLRSKDAKNAINAVKEGRKCLNRTEIDEEHEDIEFRPEQKDAIDFTLFLSFPASSHILDFLHKISSGSKYIIFPALSE